MCGFYGNSQSENGFYTLEAAISITIFTSLFMILLSLISIIRVETVVQSAINQTAMQLSQYSYAVLSVNEALQGEKISPISEIEQANDEINENKISAYIYTILKDAEREASGYIGGAVVCKAIVKNNFGFDKYDEWLEKQGISGGYDGLSFLTSNILGDGEKINVSVIYKIKVNTFGFYEKTITVCQNAQTRAWLPPGADEVFDLDKDGAEASIWQETSFVRGKYFVKKLKSAEPSAAVKSGQGIDLYYKSERIISEIFSMNVFAASYSVKSDENSTYRANEEYIIEQLKTYARKFNFDILKTQRLIEMDDGSLGNFGSLNERRLILIVPIEALQNESFKNCFTAAEKELFDKYGVTLVVKYMEEALHE